MTLYYQNARGLRTKTSEFFQNTSCCDYDLIAVTETWLDGSVFNRELFTDRFEVFRKDGDFSLVNRSRGGGVLLAVDRKFISILLNFDRDALFPQIDLIGIKIVFDHYTIYVFVLLYLHR